MKRQSQVGAWTGPWAPGSGLRTLGFTSCGSGSRVPAPAVRATPALVTLAVLLISATAGFSQDLAVQYELDDRGDVKIVTERIVAGEGVSEWRHALAPGSRGSEARAIDRATGRPLQARVQGTHLVVAFARATVARAEQRLGIEEVAGRAGYLKGAGPGAPFTFAQTVNGRVTILLPPGYSVRASSAPAQYAIENGRLKVGIIALDAPVSLRLEAEPAASVGGAAGLAAAPTAMPAGSFRAQDERSVVYWLDQPETQRIKLALELLLTTPGQRHVYSVLRNDDNITSPETLDVDRGAVLPTRIVTGREASAIGDSPAPIPADASVLVADLDHGVPAGGTVRVRSYQVALDKQGYTLAPDGELRWTRFLARLRTRIVLPAGWSLTSVDQPAAIGRDGEGRVVLDFVQAGGTSPTLLLTARRIARP
jgi:hypothetical protein